MILTDLGLSSLFCLIKNFDIMSNMSLSAFVKEELTIIYQDSFVLDYLSGLVTLPDGSKSKCILETALDVDRFVKDLDYTYSRNIDVLSSNNQDTSISSELSKLFGTASTTTATEELELTNLFDLDNLDNSNEIDLDNSDNPDEIDLDNFDTSNEIDLDSLDNSNQINLDTDTNTFELLSSPEDYVMQYFTKEELTSLVFEIEDITPANPDAVLTDEFIEFARLSALEYNKIIYTGWVRCLYFDSNNELVVCPTLAELEQDRDIMPQEEFEHREKIINNRVLGYDLKTEYPACFDLLEKLISTNRDKYYDVYSLGGTLYSQLKEIMSQDSLVTRVFGREYSSLNNKRTLRELYNSLIPLLHTEISGNREGYKSVCYNRINDAVRIFELYSGGTSLDAYKSFIERLTSGEPVQQVIPDLIASPALQNSLSNYNPYLFDNESEYSVYFILTQRTKPSLLHKLLHYPKALSFYLDLYYAVYTFSLNEYVYGSNNDKYISENEWLSVLKILAEQFYVCGLLNETSIRYNFNNYVENILLLFKDITDVKPTNLLVEASYEVAYECLCSLK